MDTLDTKLTNDGLDTLEDDATILLLACGALAHEILAIINANNWTHIALKCLPAILHNTPDKITPAVTELIQKYSTSFEKIFVVYADCGTGGQLQTLCKSLGVEMIQGPHCYSFFEGNERFTERNEVTAFYLTDFLVRQFDAFVWKPLGLDRHPDLVHMYFGNYTKLVYQAQNPTLKLEQKAQDCAKRLGLDYEYRPTGYGDLETAIVDWASR